MREEPMRYKADIKTLLWLTLATANAVVLWTQPALRPWLLPLQCYLGLCAGIVGHNHNHSPTFRNRALNHALNYWSMMFYGFPPYTAWIATHNLNHHKFTNAPGDATITWRYWNKHNLFAVLAYPVYNVYFQAPVINAYIARCWRDNRTMFRHIIAQYACIYGGLALALFLNWRAAMCIFVVPWAAALFTILYFNYGQHIHCDPYDRWNHSRSFTGGLLNFLLFNNGFHTIHHEKPGLHWSLLPEGHRAIATNMAPELNQPNLFTWMFLNYVVAPFAPRFGTKQLGGHPSQPPKPEVKAVDGGADLAAEQAIVVAGV